MTDLPNPTEPQPAQAVVIPKVFVGLDVVHDLVQWVHWARLQLSEGRLKEGSDPAIVDRMIENLAELERILQVTAETSPLVYQRVITAANPARVANIMPMPPWLPGEVGS